LSFRRRACADPARAFALALVACAAAKVPSASAPDHLHASEHAAFDTNPCVHLRGGPAGTAFAAADLGKAHALVRYFGAAHDPHDADAALAEALDTNAPDSPTAVTEYARLSRETCVLQSEQVLLGTATLTMDGGTAVITPGVGALPNIPPSAVALALDVRGLPESSEARAAVHRAFDIMLRGSVKLPNLEARNCNGQPDEVGRFVGQDADQYACRTHIYAQSHVGFGLGLPLAVLTSARLTPLATWAAIAMRTSAKAFIIGEPLVTAAGESQWVGVGNIGLAIRTRRLLAADGSPLPDIVPADVRTREPRAALQRFDWRAARVQVAGVARRAPFTTREPSRSWTPVSNRTGDARAALLVAYSAVRTFFPYVDEVGDIFDRRLEECLALIASEQGASGPDRAQVRKALWRLAEALHDGHVAVYDDRVLASWGASVALVPVASDLVVAVTNQSEVKLGDTLMSIEGTPVATWMDELSMYASGSPHAIRSRLAERLVHADTQLSLRKPDGSEHAVRLREGANTATTRGLFERAPGPLRELGASEIDYVSLDGRGSYAQMERNLPRIKADMARSRGVILDLRGYPSRASWAVLAHVLPQTAQGPMMAELRVSPWHRTLEPPEQTQTLATWSSESQGFAGPVVVLTGAGTQSQAEHMLFFFRSARRGKLIGGATSGADGTITGVQLPGGYGLTFTGMHVQHLDGSRFHAIGHIPDVRAEATAEDLRMGRDTVLLAAVAELRRPSTRASHMSR
jgi:Peptidase family S41